MTNILIYVNEDRAHQLCCAISEARAASSRAKKPEIAERYRLEYESYQKMLKDIPMTLNGRFLDFLLQSLRSHAEWIKSQIAEDNEKFNEDPVYFIKSYAGDFIKRHHDLRLTMSLIEQIERYRAKETRHWIIWLNEIFESWDEILKDGIARGISCLYSCASAFYNVVEMQELKARVEYYRDGTIHDILPKLRVALAHVRKNQPELLTAIVEPPKPEASTECAPAQEQAQAEVTSGNA